MLRSLRLKRLLRQISEGSPEGQVEAAAALGKLADRSCLEPLTRAAVEGAPAVRRSAVEALCRLGDRRATATLVVALEDAEAGVRQSAARALAATPDPRAVDALIAALGDADPGVRTASAHALWRAGEPGWSKHVHGNDEDIRALAGLRDARAVPALARALLRARWGCAADAARGLGRFGGPRAVDALIAGLRRPEPFVVGAIAVALEALGDARAAQPLLSALARPELDDAVPAIAKALGRVGGSAAVVPLLGVLSHAKPAARAAAAEALGALRDPRARDALADLVAREEGTNYHGATPWQAGARALGALADPRAIRPLLGLAPTDVSARDALRGLGLGDWVCGLTGAPGDLVRHGGEDNPWGFDLLQSALRHWGREARLYAAEELGRRLDPQTVGELVTALGDSLEVRRAAAEALAAILQAHPSALDRQTWERVADKCRQPAVHRDGPSYSHYDDPGGWDRDRLSKTIPSHGDHCDGIGVDFPDPPEGTDF